MNAQGAKSTQQQQAEQAITNGAKVILLVNLDSAPVRRSRRNAKQGVKVIDYDRLTLNGSAVVLRLVQQREGRQAAGPGPRQVPEGQGATRRSRSIAELNGSPTDNNATLFAQGYNSVLNPLYKSGKLEEGPEPVRAGLGQPEGADDLRADAARRPATRSTASLAANDGLGQRGRSRRSRRASCKQIPVTGQDATAQGIQNILAGDQCMTVYKAVKKEADAAAEARDRR